MKLFKLNLEAQAKLVILQKTKGKGQTIFLIRLIAKYTENSLFTSQEPPCIRFSQLHRPQCVPSHRILVKSTHLSDRSSAWSSPLLLIHFAFAALNKIRYLIFWSFLYSELLLALTAKISLSGTSCHMCCCKFDKSDFKCLNAIIFKWSK